MDNPPNKERWEWPRAERYVRDIGGHPPSHFARVLAETIPIERGRTRLLDIGCGSGIIGIYCLVEKGAAFVTFNDIQAEMISITRANVDRRIHDSEIVSSQVEYLQAKFNEIPPDVIGAHHLMAFNPPQLPGSLVAEDYLTQLRADDSGALFRIGAGRSNPDGLSVVRGFLHWYAQLKSSKPTAIVTLSSFLSVRRIQEAIQAYGLSSIILKRTRVPLRAALTAAAIKISTNEAQRIDRSLDQAPDGSWTKEILTISLSG